MQCIVFGPKKDNWTSVQGHSSSDNLRHDFLIQSVTQIIAGQKVQRIQFPVLPSSVVTA